MTTIRAKEINRGSLLSDAFAIGEQNWEESMNLLKIKLF